jgi:ABC-type lipoprotein release transport system permease subunit
MVAGTLSSRHGSYAKAASRGMGVTVWRIAWSNLWRNRRRTWLTAGGIAFALWMLTFAVSLNEGTFGMMIDNAARMSLGHIRLQHPDYFDDPRVEYTLADAERLAARVQSHPQVQFAVPRASSFALAAVGERSYGAQVVGVDYAADARWSTLPNMKPAGRYIQGAGEAFVGALLARNLGLEIGGEIVLLGTAKEGGVAAHVARVVGTFATGQAAMDRSVVQIPLADFREGWGLAPTEAHSVVVIADSVAISERIAPSFAGPDWVSLDWMQLMPDAEQMMDMKIFGAQLFFLVITVIVTFSIVNTFMMSVFERTPEFGTLMAIGMRPLAIVGQLMVEALWLWLMGAAIGLGVSGLLISALGFTGVPLPMDPADIISAYNIPDRLYPEFSWISAGMGVLVLFVGTQLAALVPALRIRKMRPVEARRAAE